MSKQLREDGGDPSCQVSYELSYHSFMLYLVFMSCILH